MAAGRAGERNDAPCEVRYTLKKVRPHARQKSRNPEFGKSSILAATEVHVGVDNLFKKEKDPAGAKSYPNWGKYIPKHYFQAFLCVLPLLWAPEEYWFCNQNELPWAVLQPFLDKRNA